MTGPSGLTADLNLMRELNRALVLQLVRREGRISRADIAKQTKLSRSTVSSIISDLIDEQLVTETGIGTSKGGRRPIILEFNYQASYIIGLDVEQTALNAVITDLDARICHRRTVAFEIGKGPQTGLPIMKKLITTMLNESPVGRGNISAIGIGIPAPLDYRTGRTIAPPVMPGWDNVPLKEEMFNEFNIPVSVDNDANLAAMAEFRWGAGKGAQNMVYVYMSSSGIGAGFIIDSHVYRGAIGSAGEIGHITLNIRADDPTAGPLNAGSLEALASESSLMCRACDQGLIAADDSIEALLAQAATKPQLQRLVEQQAHYLGVAIAGVINLFNPDRVVVGGCIPEASQYFMDVIQRTVVQRGLSIAVQRASIVPGSLGQHVVALGAAALATERLFAPPALERPATLGIAQHQHTLM